MMLVRQTPIRAGLPPRSLISLITVWASAAVAITGADTPKSKNSDLVTVRGCLHGQVLTTIDETGTNGHAPQRFNLTGDRRTLQTLKEHSSHLEEITGVLKGGPADGGVKIAEKPIDKGRIYIGVGKAHVTGP